MKKINVQEDDGENFELNQQTNFNSCSLRLRHHCFHSAYSHPRTVATRSHSHSLGAPPTQPAVDPARVATRVAATARRAPSAHVRAVSPTTGGAAAPTALGLAVRIVARV